MAIWLSGPTGTGKSSWVWEHFQREEVYPVPRRATTGHCLWWDHYTQQKVVLIDDIRPSWFSFNDLLAVINHIPYWCRTQAGSFVPFNSRLVVITSIFAPQQFPAADEPAAQLYRRISLHARTRLNNSPEYWRITPETGEEIHLPASIALPRLGLDHDGNTDLDSVHDGESDTQELQEESEDDLDPETYVD